MHKFKLKKDGKVVGYLQIIGRPKGILFSPSLGGVWIPFLGTEITFDTAHPFVCKENGIGTKGRDIFAGDQVRRTYEQVGWMTKDGEISKHPDPNISVPSFVFDKVELIKE